MNFTELEPYYHRIDLLKLTVEQIKKDFDLYNLEISFSGEESSAYEELTSQIVPHIQGLINKNYEQFLNLLYRIDVPEKKLSEIIKNTAVNKVVAISDLIIKRELQKVVIKAYYNQNRTGETSELR